MSAITTHTVIIIYFSLSMYVLIEQYAILCHKTIQVPSVHSTTIPNFSSLFAEICEISVSCLQSALLSRSSVMSVAELPVTRHEKH